jgi:non-heme chloroperoxidase
MRRSSPQRHSDRPPGGYAPRDMAADVLGFMDALGIERATLVGHSMGTFVAQRAAIAAPERVAGLVLLGSATTALNAVMVGLRDSLATLPDVVPAPFALEFQSGTTHQPTPEDFMARAVAESLKAPARVWRDALSGLLEEERFGGLTSSGFCAPPSPDGRLRPAGRRRPRARDVPAPAGARPTRYRGGTR